MQSALLQISTALDASTLAVSAARGRVQGACLSSHSRDSTTAEDTAPPAGAFNMLPVSLSATPCLAVTHCLVALNNILWRCIPHRTRSAPVRATGQALQAWQGAFRTVSGVSWPMGVHVICDSCGLTYAPTQHDRVHCLAAAMRYLCIKERQCSSMDTWEAGWVKH